MRRVLCLCFVAGCFAALTPIQTMQAQAITGGSTSAPAAKSGWMSWMHFGKKKPVMVAPVAAAPVAVESKRVVAEAPTYGGELWLDAGSTVHAMVTACTHEDERDVAGRFEATVSEPVMSGGKVLIPAGAKATGEVKPLESMNVLELNLVMFGGKVYGLRTALPKGQGEAVGLDGPRLQAVVNGYGVAALETRELAATSAVFRFDGGAEELMPVAELRVPVAKMR